jgi:16S rRNA processing protein RimM
MSEPSPAAPEWLVVGRVIRPHGLHGEVLVEVLSDAPDRFAPGAQVAVAESGQPDADPAAGAGPRRQLTVAAVRLAQGRQLVRFDGYEDRTAAEALRGAVLSIPFTAARQLGEGEYWPHQLVGLDVVDSEGTRHGTVTDVVPGAAHDLLDVALEAGGSVLVPTVAALVTVELDAHRVVVAPVGGLLGQE